MQETNLFYVLLTFTGLPTAPPDVAAVGVGEAVRDAAWAGRWERNDGV